MFLLLKKRHLNYVAVQISFAGFSSNLEPRFDNESLPFTKLTNEITIP